MTICESDLEEFMNGAELKDRVHGGGIVYGTMISMGRNPRWTSAFANFGIDYVIIDTEHSPRGRMDVADFIAAFTFSGCGLSCGFRYRTRTM